MPISISNFEEFPCDHLRTNYLGIRTVFSFVSSFTWKFRILQLKKRWKRKVMNDYECIQSRHHIAIIQTAQAHSALALLDPLCARVYLCWISFYFFFHFLFFTSSNIPLHVCILMSVMADWQTENGEWSLFFFIQIHCPT